MALFNYATRELSAKIVYYGPGLSGKTTNIEMVHDLLRPEQKGKLISLPTETDRTLFFDFLPLDLGEIKGFRVRFHLYTVPGQVFYNATRRLVLQGVDGVVFVADSQAGMMESNVESLKNLVDNLTTYGKKLKDLPFVIQYNKRDLRNISPVREMNARLNTMNVPCFEAVAVNGTGVSETLVAVSRLVFEHLRKTLLLPGDMPASPPAPGAAAAAGPRRSAPAEPESIEEISEIEDIGEEPGMPGGLDMPAGEMTDFASLSRPASAAEGRLPLEGIEEIEIEIPERFPEPEGGAAAPPEGAGGKGEEAEALKAAPAPPEAAPAGEAGEFPFEGLEEIEIEIPEGPAEAEAGAEAPPGAAAGPASVAVEVEGSDLTFLKFDNVFVSTEGYVVLPAVFLDPNGNLVRIRIKISMAGERE